MLLGQFGIFGCELQLILSYLFGGFAQSLLQLFFFCFCSLEFFLVVVESGVILLYFEHRVDLAPQVLIHCNQVLVSLLLLLQFFLQK